MTNTPSDHAPAPDNPSWFERNVSLIIVGLVVACVLSLLAEVIWHSTFFDEKHPAHFKLENTYFYSAGFGFCAFVAVVFLGKLLRPIIKRPEDYYDQ
ncbi:MAG: hypothetical protein P8J33_16010 [Pirellulaceae bacterium]|nr:hypothetical protein [Pirellulaceae bacterium]